MVQNRISVACSKIRNSANGTLLTDLSKIGWKDAICAKFEWWRRELQRPTAWSPKLWLMRPKAIDELGLTSALDRRYATAPGGFQRQRHYIRITEAPAK